MNVARQLDCESVELFSICKPVNTKEKEASNKKHGCCCNAKALYSEPSARYIELVLVFLMIHLMRRWVKNSQCHSLKILLNCG